ncbi:CAMK family protein kinase [Trichomonas vaginalis G3]|uniref:CAMK family protein kinase n=1 Tax=Trichomonas vaginalis (strain ATCC PRA-98 / G3) TaxID=412133 RepID=A2GEW4_TRIV3|nr:protein serine/threonine kinase protein [Trichomonas vaginalis G3]EAX84301.1 CAMK family protein kinase [Trichomonas vaginalis G3]KAI5551716.1 protein serine/threonine kinase protein [Trichomonas vaginalis G3]|eukprot:XP_001297231.1 CAMK family protein kinase [Trichomonas vaginalis G3]
MSQDTSKLKEILLRNGYVLLEQIGAGGFATCYKVFDQKYQQVFVCKVYKSQDEVEKDKVNTQMNQFSHEIDALCKIFQTYIMRIYNYFIEENMFFLILEYCPNGSIQDLIKHEGRIDHKRLLQYIYQAASALQYCHSKKFAHHDIKPANLLIDENFNIKLSDFGMAEIGATQCDKYGGTVAYLAPEVFLRQPYDPFKSDVWSFGATVYFMASGTVPFTGNNQTEMKQLICNGCYIMPRNVSPEIRTIIKNTLLLNPEERWDMTEIVAHLKCFQETKISSHNSTSVLLLNRNSIVGSKRISRINSYRNSAKLPEPQSISSSSVSRLLDTFAE